jgi:hypothetical protein
LPLLDYQNADYSCFSICARRNLFRGSPAKSLLQLIVVSIQRPIERAGIDVQSRSHTSQEFLTFSIAKVSAQEGTYEGLQAVVEREMIAGEFVTNLHRDVARVLLTDPRNFLQKLNSLFGGLQLAVLISDCRRTACLSEHPKSCLSLFCDEESEPRVWYLQQQLLLPILRRQLTDARPSKVVSARLYIVFPVP